MIIGASEGERKFLGVKQIAALVRSLREEFDSPIFLNADRTHSLKNAVEAAEAGFDAIVLTSLLCRSKKTCVRPRPRSKRLKQLNPAILIEGEIGDIGTGSEIHDAAPDLSKDLTTPKEAKQYVDATGVDILAPAVGHFGKLTALDLTHF